MAGRRYDWGIAMIAAGFRIVGAAIPLVLVLLGCRPTSERTSEGWVLTRTGLGTIRLCSALDSVSSVLRSARDTIFEYGEDRWPARMAAVDSGVAVFAASPADTLRIWTISVTSPIVRSTRGYRVGQPIRLLLDAREPMSVLESEGQLVLELTNEGVSMSVDSASEAQYFADDSSAPPSMARVPASATIRKLFVSGGCASR